MTAFDDAWDFMKAMKPHRQKVLPEGADTHMRLQQWANRHPSTKEAFASGGDEARVAHRDSLMREAVADPAAHGLMFVGGEPIPFDEEERQSTLEEFTKMVPSNVNTRSSAPPRQPASFRRRMRNPTTTAGAPAATPQTKEPQGQFLQQQATQADKGRITDMQKLKQTDPEAYQKLLLEQQYAPDQRLNQTRLLDFVGKMDVYKANPDDMYRNQSNPNYFHHPQNPFDRPLPARPDDPVCPRCQGSGKNFNTFHHGGPPDCSDCGGTGKIRRTMGDIYRQKNPQPGQPQPPTPPHETPYKPNTPYGPEQPDNKAKCKSCGKPISLRDQMQRYNWKGLCPDCEYRGGGMPSPYTPPGGPPPYESPMSYERQHPETPTPLRQRSPPPLRQQVGVTPGTMYK
tara:strand:- start:2143 stop:3339 length:1197 start_codon:yes stop_codon:yes gene_type:complete